MELWGKSPKRVLRVPLVLETAVRASVGVGVEEGEKEMGRRRSRLRWIMEGVGERVTVGGGWRKADGGGRVGGVEAVGGAVGEAIGGSCIEIGIWVGRRGSKEIVVRLEAG